MKRYKIRRKTFNRIEKLNSLTKLSQCAILEWPISIRDFGSFSPFALISDRAIRYFSQQKETRECSSSRTANIFRGVFLDFFFLLRIILEDGHSFGAALPQPGYTRRVNDVYWKHLSLYFRGKEIHRLGLSLLGKKDFRRRADER